MAAPPAGPTGKDVATLPHGLTLQPVHLPRAADHLASPDHPDYLGDAVPVPPSLLNDLTVVGPLGSLAISQIKPRSSSLALRAIRWHEGLERLGLVLPFFMVHDVGLLFAAPREQLELGARCPIERLQRPHLDPGRGISLHDIEGYRALLDEIGESEAARRAPQLKLNDDLITVVLSRVLGTVASRLTVTPGYRSRIPVDASLFDGIESQLAALFETSTLPAEVRVSRVFEIQTLRALADARLFVLTMADALDIDTLRLFGMLGSEASAGALAQVDLLAALESPEANDIVNFSLEILPSVLETKTRPAAGTSAAHGFSGINTRGTIDGLVLTELAWDDLELARRIADNEVLYYAREQSREEQRRIHYLLVDASASMRGDRQTFARGMAIATGKKLLLEGEDVAFRFYDARLYEIQRAKSGQLPTAHILSFKGERGRNPARVFAELATDLDIARHHDPRTPVVHLFTHAALYIPREMVQAVRAHAHLSAVFILPSGGQLDLDYLDLLDAHWVVDHATIAGGGAARATAARSILGETHGDAATAPVSLRSVDATAHPSSARDDEARLTR
ncbi:hypothetical protein [Chondromyces crocatus]|uniref:Uncharacterized protein n=1 Tax=Chondromyces crocatus TaxID=52 RepID=A0A0K1EDK1_CHOCO|nr:hypothetical protein [Chondromyces crocatus]AKT38638.1 uncharacterized protein CMC5_027850 [Chondromyces crocatus]